MNTTRTDYHCIICNLVKYTKEDLWIPKETYRQLELDTNTTVTSGIFHTYCIDRYFVEYVPSIPEKDKERIRRELEERIKEETKTGGKRRC